MAERFVIGLDEGTTGITVLVYDSSWSVRHRGYAEIRQSYPKPGWVEHDPDEIRETSIRLLRRAGESCGGAVAALGITNQRETVVPYDVQAKRALGPAIVWQCRRTAERCDLLRSRGFEEKIRDRTGLVLDPYFSASKMQWMLEHDAKVLEAASRGVLRFLTIDSYLIASLTASETPLTDPTNASRTMLLDLETGAYSAELLSIFGIESTMLAEVRPSTSFFGETDPSLLGFRAPICGVAGDQQAALFGHGAVLEGQAKNTYGTGCFLLMAAGRERPKVEKGLLTTLGVGADGGKIFVVEGAVFIAGAVVQWLRDELRIIHSADETEALARSLPDNAGVYLVPAFAGLGAPHWDAAARGLITGLTRGAGRAHLVRAALESIAYQVHDLVALFGAARPITALSVDGGAARNNWLMEFQAGLLGIPILRSDDVETTCKGAALLAAAGAGLLGSVREAVGSPSRFRRFEPSLEAELREKWLLGWHSAVQRARSGLKG